MKKFDFLKKPTFKKSPKRIINIFLVVVFAFIFTAILVSKYVFFQTIVGSDNNSKVMVVAPKDIEVVDSIKTERRKREVSQNVPLVYTPADSIYIKNSLNELIDDVVAIRNSNLSYKDKERELGVIFDISEG